MSEYREVQRKLDRQIAGFGKALFTLKFWHGIWALIGCAYFLLVVPFVSVPRQLFFTGGGYLAAPILGLIIAIHVIFWLAVESQTLPGDTLFLVGFILVGKAIWEFIASLRRQHGQAWEKRLDEAVSLLAPLGISSEAATFGVAAVVGLAITPLPFGYFLGPILFLGGVGGVLTALVVGAQRHVEVSRVRKRDFVMRAQASRQQRALERPGGQHFQDVDLG